MSAMTEKLRAAVESATMLDAGAQDELADAVMALIVLRKTGSTKWAAKFEASKDVLRGLAAGERELSGDELLDQSRESE